MSKKGFTLVEVALFLALSGLLVASVIAGTSRSISSKRYDDTVNNFVSYLEDLYSSVNYVHHNNTGMTSQAVYGKLINMFTDGAGKTTFTSYTILGNSDTKNINESDALSALLKLEPTIIDSSGNFVLSEEYKLSWNGKVKVQQTAGNEKSQILLLIISHPKNGMKFTYVYYPNTTININTSTRLTHDGANGLIGDNYNSPNGNFQSDNANFCVDSDDRWAGDNKRRLVRIYAGANNASGVELISNEKKESDGFCL